MSSDDLHPMIKIPVMFTIAFTYNVLVWALYLGITMIVEDANHMRAHINTVAMNAPLVASVVGTIILFLFTIIWVVDPNS